MRGRLSVLVVASLAVVPFERAQRSEGSSILNQERSDLVGVKLSHSSSPLAGDERERERRAFRRGIYEVGELHQYNYPTRYCFVLILCPPEGLLWPPPKGNVGQVR